MQNKVTIHTDGGARGNPGPAGIGVVLKCGNKQLTFKKFIGEATNNQAEYQAVILGLEKAKEEASKLLLPGKEPLYSYPGTNIKWFTDDNDPILNTSKSGAEKFAFFIDGIIYSSAKQQELAFRAGLQQDCSIILPDQPYFIFDLENKSAELLRLKLLIEAKKTPLHVYCIWDDASFYLLLPETKTKKSIWQKYLHGFKQAQTAKKQTLVQEVRELAKELPASLKFYLISKQDKLPPLNNGLIDFIKSVNPSRRKLNIRSCFCFLLAGNLDKAALFLKKIKDKNYRDAFSIILAIESGNYKKAIDLYKKGALFLPGFIKSYLLSELGIAHYELQEKDEAIKLWQQALALDPANYTADMSLAFLKILSL